MPLYYEDFHVGQSFTTLGRTISEFDLVQFAALTGDNSSAHTGGLVQLQFGDWPQLTAVLIASRPMKQQILDYVDLQPGQEQSPLRPHAPERAYWLAQWRSGGSDKRGNRHLR